MRHLAVLELDHNNIKHLRNDSFHHLHSLRYLDLSNNFLTHLSPETFAPLNQLHALLLASNNLTSLAEHTFSGIHKITKIDLRNNSLKFIDSEQFSSMLMLKALFLNGNNFPCACEVHAELWSLTALMGVECLDEEGLRKELLDIECSTSIGLIGPAEVVLLLTPIQVQNSSHLLKPNETSSVQKFLSKIEVFLYYVA